MRLANSVGMVSIMSIRKVFCWEIPYNNLNEFFIHMCNFFYASVIILVSLYKF